MKYCVALRPDAREDEFRDVARRCLSNRLPPAEINFGSTEQSSLFEPLPDGDEKFALNVPREFTDLMRYAICNRAEDRFALLYDVLWRIAHGERELVQNYADAHVSRLHRYAKNVRRDIHKMHAFVRFRKQESDDGGLFTAWFEPQHFILREAVPFFVDRFSKMNWLIATPIGTACFDQHRVAYGPAIDKPIAPTDTVLDSLWLTYFKTTFNPARLRKKAMLAEMPMHYWRNMPETTLSTR